MTDSNGDAYEGEIERGYDQTHFEMVACGADQKYELPTSTAARYRMGSRTDPSAFKTELDKRGYAFIAPYQEEGYLSSKLLDTETNEFLHIKINGDLLRIFPKSEDFSIETFKRIVECVDTHVVSIELEGGDE